LACGPELDHGGQRFQVAGARGGGRRGEVRGGADVRDRPGRGRKDERVLGLGRGRKRREERKPEGEKESGPAWPMRGEGGIGKREMGCGKKGPAQGEERELVGLPSLPLLFFLFSTLKLFKQFYLNSNKFESKPYTLNTNKTMLQECTNKLIL
jgi:hypothetical protein